MSNLAFGQWNNRWGWRVEWVENGILVHKDFYQEEERAGLAKEKADAFRLELGSRAA